MKAFPARVDDQAISSDASMADLWGDFSRIAVPHLDPTGVQYEDTRAIFYFGAFYLLSWLTALGEVHQEQTPEGEARLAAIGEELNALVAQYRSDDRGVASVN